MAVDIPSGWTPRPGRCRRGRRGGSDRDLPRAQGGSRGRARQIQGRRCRRCGHRAGTSTDGACARAAGDRAAGPAPPPGSTKYTAGSRAGGRRVAGDDGAVTLTAEAAFRADAGYVAVAAPPESLPVIEARLLRGRQAAARRGRWTRPGGPRARDRPGLGRRSGRARSAPARRRPTFRRWSTPTACASSSRSSGRRRRCSRRTPASSAGCSARRRPGSTRTGWRRCAARWSASAASCS